MTQKGITRQASKAGKVYARRRELIIKGAQALTLGTFFSTNSYLLAANKKDDPRKHAVKVGDQLCLPSWEEDGRKVRPEDVLLNQPPLLVYPCEPESGVIKDRSRLNQILVARLEKNSLDKVTSENSADGVVAYSGLCTHTACAVSEWDESASVLVCPCHGSEFNPSQSGIRMNGPAPRSLPALPISLIDNSYVVTALFTSKVGSSI
jgi:rieske iron-sulfur protein|tara:strand:+ start:137 stop:757 length:621 start_codon:yes stop_codon:yes gene_type:complete